MVSLVKFLVHKCHPSFHSTTRHIHILRKRANFIGASEEMKIDTIKVKNGPVQQFSQTSGITWKFNVPYAFHMGGIWNRMIGMTRKTLNSMLLESRSKTLTHEVLVTFLCEVCAIIHSRSINPISIDSDEPSPVHLWSLQKSWLLTSGIRFLRYQGHPPSTLEACSSPCSILFWRTPEHRYHAVSTNM